MSTPFNDQWILGRARARRRERSILARALGRAGDPHVPPQESEEAAAAEGSGCVTGSRSGADAAITRSPARKRPRWIDRDT